MGGARDRPGAEGSRPAQRALVQGGPACAASPWHGGDRSPQIKGLVNPSGLTWGSIVTWGEAGHVAAGLIPSVAFVHWQRCGSRLLKASSVPCCLPTRMKLSQRG